MRGHRLLLLAVVLLVVGGALLFWSGMAALGLVALAGVAGLLATSGVLRAVVGGVLVALGVLGGVVAVVGAGSMLDAIERTAAATGSLAVLAAGIGALLLARHAPLATDRFERDSGTANPGREPAATSLDLWRALDRGEDPTTHDAAAGADGLQARLDDAEDSGR